MIKIQTKSEGILDFFNQAILAISITSMPDEKQLTRKEGLFLAHCCVFNYLGGNLSSSDELWEYFNEIKFFRRRNDINVYKTKLMGKGWIRCDRKNFISLPPMLNYSKNTGVKAKLEIVYNAKNVNKNRSYSREVAG